MTDSQRKRRLEKAQLRVLFDVPFFAPGVAKLPVRFDASVPTACTDGKEIVWNPEFFDKLEDPVLPMILAHETAHCLLGHLWRMPVGADGSMWNIACDHAVNLMLEEFGKLRTSQGLADPFPFPKDFPACKDPKYSGMSEEQIYRLMENQGQGGGGQQQAPPQAGAGGQSKSGQSGGQPGKPPKSPPASGAGQSGGGQKTPTQPSIGEFKAPAGGAAAAKESKSDWQSTLLQSAAAAKGRGSLPGSVQRMIGELVSPKVPWQELLRSFLRERVQDDWNWVKPNPHFDDSGFIMPSLDSERLGPVVFATDWSGSIDTALATAFESEKQNCLDDMRPSRLVDIVFDTRVASLKEYRQGDEIRTVAQAGGGTDFRCVFTACDGLAEAPKCLVVLTDLDGRMPDKAPEYPVIWISYNARGEQAPFGQTVEV